MKPHDEALTQWASNCINFTDKEGMTKDYTLEELDDLMSRYCGFLHAEATNQIWRFLNGTEFKGVYKSDRHLEFSKWLNRFFKVNTFMRIQSFKELEDALSQKLKHVEDCIRAREPILSIPVEVGELSSGDA